MPDVGRSYSGTFTYFKCVATEGSKLVSKGTVMSVTLSSYLSNAKVNAHFIDFSTSTILYVLTLMMSSAAPPSEVTGSNPEPHVGKMVVSYHLLTVYSTDP